MNTIKTITYKGIKISETNFGYFIFEFNGVINSNTNLRFAKTQINRKLKLQKALNVSSDEIIEKSIFDFIPENKEELINLISKSKDIFIQSKDYSTRIKIDKKAFKQSVKFSDNFTESFKIKVDWFFNTQNLIVYFL